MISRIRQIDVLPLYFTYLRFKRLKFMTNTMTAERLTECLTLVQSALDDMKAKNITVMNVEELTDVTERIIIADGTSK
ncbi:RsfS/YbeB/iojap family protein, partial [Marinobacter sp. 1Y8]